MGYRLSGSTSNAAKDAVGSFLKIYTIGGSDGLDYVRFPPGAIIERITITDPNETNVDVIINNVSRQIAFPNPIVTTTQISTLNAGSTDPKKYAIDQLDFLCGSLGLYNEIFGNGASYVRIQVLFLPPTAVLSFRYYIHPNFA